MLAVIGSVALIVRGYNIGRKPSDHDLVGDYDELIKKLQQVGCTTIIPIAQGKKVVGRNQTIIFECEIAWEKSTSAELLELIANDKDTLKDGDYMYPSLNVLYMLKMTHRFKKNNPHFLKTMQDIHLMREWGAVIQPEHKEFFKRRLKETLNYSHPKLNQSKKEFFTDDVPYTYDHDSIHEAIKLNDKPAYAYFKDDEKEVLVSRELFFKLPLDIQIAAVYEESCVLALERSQIPFPNMDRLDSFYIALEKVCTSITSGWFREFAWEHYYDVTNLYGYLSDNGDNYKDIFDRVLERGDTILLHGNRSV
jgi:hypothetical protein